MPKRLLLILLIVAVVGAVGYYAFSRWSEAREKVNLWTLVPEDAVFIIETEDHTQLLTELRKTEYWANISALPYFQRVEERIATLDSLSSGKNSMERFLDKKRMLTSLHVTGTSEFDLVAYIPVETVAEHRHIRTLTENLNKESDRFRQEVREYQGYQITDVKFLRTGGQLTFFTYHNNLIISASPVLVEEIIRRISRDQLESVAKEFETTNYLSQNDVHANVFISNRNLPRFLGLFVNETLQPDIDFLLSLCKNSMLQLKFDNAKIFLNGFSTPESASDAFYKCMEGQQPKSFELQQYISNRTAALLHFGLDQASALKKCRSVKSALSPDQKALIDSLRQTFTREVAVCYLESYRANTSPEKVLYAHTANPNLTSALLKEIVAEQVALTGEKLPDEKYGKQLIRLINIPEFPTLLFGPVFKGFDQCYVIQMGDYMAFSDDVATLRTLLKDIETENVWGKSAQQKGFLEETKHQANLSFYLNTTNAWHILNRYATEEKRAALLRHQNLIKKFNHFSFQYSLEGNEYYTSILLKHEQPETKTKPEEALAVDQTLTFRAPLISRPYLVRNPVDRSPEVMVQDSAYRIYTVSAAGKITWKDSVAGPIAGQVYQAALTSDGKTRYVFAAANKIYSFDRFGKLTENFPFNLGDSVRLQQLAVFDYEKNHNYRLLVDDYLGNIYMFDAMGNNLAGWAPKAMEYRLAVEPQHYAVSGKDVILVMLENGYVYALNRQGEAYPGFPISLGGPVKSPAFASLGINFRKSLFTVVTQLGQVITFNLNGEITDREQLLRTSRRAVFELVPEAEGKSFVVARQDLGRVTFFDQDLNAIFEKTYVTSAPKIIQFYHFGGDKKIYVVTETGPQKTYLYNAKGQQIGNKTIENRLPVSILYNDSDNSYNLFKTHFKELRRINFKL